MEITDVQCTYERSVGTCVARLTPRQVEFSKRKYGRPLCWAHQRQVDLESAAQEAQENNQEGETL